MTDRKKTLQGLKCCSMNGNGCRQCPYNKECDEMPDFGNAQLCSDALELLKENDIELERIYQNICTYINGGCSTDTEADKQHVCEMIGRIFCAGGRVVLTNGVEAQGRWISTRNRLPEKDGKYLCVWQGRSIDTGMFTNGHFRLYGEVKDKLVSHWMSLPEPPKEESDD